MQQVGLTSVPPGAGPFHYETAEQKDVRVDIVARDITHGYSVLFLPNGDALIVERGLSLRLLRGATGMSPELVATPVANVPEFSKVENLHPDDVLGIQDVALHPDFAANGLIYFTYNKPVSYDAVAKRLNTVSVLGRAKFDGMKLSNARDLLVGETVIGTGGSRILFGPGKTLYISIGALSTGDIDSAQRTDNIYGKVLRINTDGSIPADNPFAKVKGARPEIWTYGHRDPLGLAIDPRSGSVVASEHGPQGGDELNVLLPGRNYGWPKYSYGTEYAGSPLPAMPVGADTVGPIVTWLPAVAPNGIAFYTGDAIPAWKNNLFIASARRGQINGTGALLRVVFNDKLQEMRQESLLDDLHQRFKDVRQGPDGMLYALTDENSSVLLRISPASRPVR
ncbi:MAG: PQQ-dependent sugar dehydrogenase [Sphingorhabdus sp.]